MEAEKGLPVSPTEQPYVPGEKVRHTKRPEWGVGVIQRAESLRRGVHADQRLSIRFANAGLKTVLASVADLQRVNGDAAVSDNGTLVDREMAGETGWLAEISKKKPADAMTSIPSQATDAFIPVWRRLEFVLGLYRFEPVGGKLIDWAVAQSGLDDPLSRFNRHELEQFFANWAIERDAALSRLLQDMEVRNNPGMLRDVVSKAPAAGQQAVRRISAFR